MSCPKRALAKESIRQRSKPDIPVLRPRDTNIELINVQARLDRLGYYIDDYVPGRLDTPTQMALCNYQAFFQLEPTGTTDPQTVKSLAAPRCGTGDRRGREYKFKNHELTRTSHYADLRVGCDYRGEATLTYWVSDSDLPNGFTLNDMVVEIGAAFQAWQQYIRLSFQRVLQEEKAIFKIGAYAGRHGDDNDFDGRFGELAHAYYPGKCGRGYAGLCHFNKDAHWSTQESERRYRLDIRTMAVHEIGHLLGLVHSTNIDSIMYPQYLFTENRLTRRQLSPDVISIIQGIYGGHPAAG